MSLGERIPKRAESAIRSGFVLGTFRMQSGLRRKGEIGEAGADDTPASQAQAYPLKSVLKASPAVELA
jgi:hypothetical protein